MLNNVKDFGAGGDGVQDDRQAIQEAINDAAGNGKAGILFPAGTYRISRVTLAGGRWSLNLNGVQDFMVMSQEPKSVVKLVDTTQLPLLECKSCHLAVSSSAAQRVVEARVAGWSERSRRAIRTARTIRSSAMLAISFRTWTVCPERSSGSRKRASGLLQAGRRSSGRPMLDSMIDKSRSHLTRP